MPLNINQMNSLTSYLIKANGNIGVSSIELAKALGIDSEVVYESIKQMQKLENQLIYITQSTPDSNTSYGVKIPENEKWRATNILDNGGWGVLFDAYYTNRKTENEKSEKRKLLEEESWNAVKVQSEEAKKTSKMANVISITSVIIALFSLMLQLFKR